MKQTEITEKEMKQAMEEMECWSVQNHLGKCKKCKALILKEVEKTCEEVMQETEKEIVEAIKANIYDKPEQRLLKMILGKEAKKEEYWNVAMTTAKNFVENIFNEQRLVLKKGKQI